MKESGDNGAGILKFKVLRQTVNQDSSLTLYEAKLNAHVFAYLYLRSATCSLVWRGPHGFQFNSELPFEFHDIQFTDLPVTKIGLQRRSIPLSGSSMIHKGYKYTKCQVTLFLAGEAGLREYDLINTDTRDKYATEIVADRDALANIAFGRYDYDLEYSGRFISYSLTIEKLDDSESKGWEFTINIPRNLDLKDATLKWIARHHLVTDMRRMNFKSSLDELSKIIKPREILEYA